MLPSSATTSSFSPVGSSALTGPWYDEITGAQSPPLASACTALTMRRRNPPSEESLPAGLPSTTHSPQQGRNSASRFPVHASGPPGDSTSHREATGVSRVSTNTTTPPRSTPSTRKHSPSAHRVSHMYRDRCRTSTGPAPGTRTGSVEVLVRPIIRCPMRPFSDRGQPSSWARGGHAGTRSVGSRRYRPSRSSAVFHWPRSFTSRTAPASFSGKTARIVSTPVADGARTAWKACSWAASPISWVNR